MGMVDTSFDISTFMPEDANSIRGTQIEETEFGAATHAYILLEDSENWQTLALKEEIAGIRGVAAVDWLDDMLDIYTPEAFLSQDALSSYKKDGATILIVAFDEAAATEMVDSAIGRITDMMMQGDYFGGSPVVMNELRRLIDSEQPVYLVIAGAILVAVLAISLSSYLAPVLCIVNIAIAILLNYGTNFIVRPQVSFVTIAIAAILQLAVSMDYSIFLIHRFEEDLALMGGDTQAAMAASMRETLTAISSSAMTDCAGFVALIFMHNQIGADLGIVLSKGVLFSLIVSITFLPCLILATYKAGRKRHRVLMPSLKLLAKPLVRLRYALLAVVVIITVPLLIGGGKQDYYYTTEEFMPDDTPPIIATRKIGETFGTTDTVSVLYEKDMAAYEPQAIDAVQAIPNVRDAAGMSGSVALGVPDSFLPDALKDQYVGENYRRFSVTLARDLGNDDLFAAIDDIRTTAGSILGDVYVAGSYASAADMASTAAWDNVAVEFISMAFIFVILLIAYRSLLIPVFLVVVIKAAIYINMGVNWMIGQEMIFLTPVIVGSIQLGATVDYAILFTSRYLEFRRKIVDTKQAVRETIRAVSRPMMTSVLTFFFATLSITIVSSVKATREIATVVGRGALISFVVILFALPALLIAFDRPLMATTLTMRAHRSRGKHGRRGRIV